MSHLRQDSLRRDGSKSSEQLFAQQSIQFCLLFKFEGVFVVYTLFHASGYRNGCHIICKAVVIASMFLPLKEKRIIKSNCILTRVQTFNNGGGINEVAATQDTNEVRVHLTKLKALLAFREFLIHCDFALKQTYDTKH